MQIDDLNAQNSLLETDFQNEINKNNDNNRQVGQIIHSINNIYRSSCVYNEIKNKKTP